jgi:hypothetical protein
VFKVATRPLIDGLAEPDTLRGVGTSTVMTYVRAVRYGEHDALAWQRHDIVADRRDAPSGQRALRSSRLLCGRRTQTPTPSNGSERSAKMSRPHSYHLAPTPRSGPRRVRYAYPRKTASRVGAMHTRSPRIGRPGKCKRTGSPGSLVEQTAATQDDRPGSYSCASSTHDMNVQALGPSRSQPERPGGSTCEKWSSSTRRD